MSFPIEFGIRRIGIAIALYPGSLNWSMEVQRAPDSGGSPDTGNAESIAVVAPGTRTYIDPLGFTATTYYYRARHVRAGATAGSWTDWTEGATSVSLPSELPAPDQIVAQSVFLRGANLGPLHHNATTRSHTGDTSETTLETITVPADTLGTDGTLRMTAFFDLTGTSGTKTIRVKWATAPTFSVAVTASDNSFAWLTTLLFNDGATNSQQLINKIETVDGFRAMSDASVGGDSTTDLDLVITGQLGDAGDTIALGYTLVELLGAK